MRKLSFIVFLLFIQYNFGQKNNFNNLEKNITLYNDHFQYEKSIKLLNHYLDNDTISHYHRFEIYLLKANTYKRLFNYEEVLQYLELAEKEGLQSDQKEKTTNIIRAERALAYYDLQDIDKGNELSQETIKNNFKDLSSAQKFYILVMKGAISIAKNQIAEAEQKLNEAEELGIKECPRELPLVYAKKTVLYNALKLPEKENHAFNLGLSYAKKYNILKYEMYMYEVKKYICIDNNDNENLKFYQRKIDSLSIIYNAIMFNGKITLIEKNFLDQQHLKENQSEHQLTISLIGLVIVLLLLLVTFYQLYKKNKEKRKLVEEENRRIHQEISRLTAETNEKGENKIDLSNYELTERQIEIINLIKQGKTNKEIGHQLFISENTVKYHLKVIYDILDIAHRSELR